MSQIIPIFSSHYSVGSSILTLEEAGKTVVGNPVSICDIAKNNDLKQVVLVEDRIDGFIEAYKNLGKVNTQLIYGIKICVCDNVSIKDDASLKNESNVIIFIKNSQGYNDLIRIWNRAWTDGFYYHGRTDWNMLKSLWTENLILAIPYFSGFIAKNILTTSSIVPALPVPSDQVILFQDIGSNLPFTWLIDAGVALFSETSGCTIQKVKHIYYEKASDFKTYQTFRAIHNRSEFSSPGVDNLASDQFSFEAWRALNAG